MTRAQESLSSRTCAVRLVNKGRAHPAAITMSDVTTTDLYEVTTAMSYLREDMRAPATSNLFVRDLPPGRGFLVAAGLEPSLDYLADYVWSGRTSRSSRTPCTARSGTSNHSSASPSKARSAPSRRAARCSPVNHCRN